MQTSLFRTLPSLQRSIARPNAHVRYFASKSSKASNKGNNDKASAATPKPERTTEAVENLESSVSSTSGNTAPPSPTSLSLDFSPMEEGEPGGGSGDRTGARSNEGSLSSIERRRRFMSRAVLASFGLGMIATAVYLGREWEEDELQSRKKNQELASMTRLERTKTRFSGLFDYFSKPTWEELLPPPVPAPYQKPYTLLLSIDDLLVTSTWDRQNGWRTAKRPGVDYFLGYLSQFYEIVIFTSQNHYTAMPVLEKLDPYNFFITYKLFRESTRSVNGVVVKDLNYLNRDLSHTLIIDTDSEHVSLQPENAIVLPKWNGDPKDKGLVAMIPFLESIAIYRPNDVRPILKAYEGKNIPVEYAKKEAEAKEKFLEEWRQSGKSKTTTGPGFTLSGLFGGSSEPPPPEPLTYLEQKRKEAQAHYRADQAYIATNRENFERMLEEERKAAAAQMSGSLWSVMTGIAGGPPPLPPSGGEPSQASASAPAPAEQTQSKA